MADSVKEPDCDEIDSLEMQEDKWDFEDLKFCTHCFDTMESVETYQSHFMYTLEGKVECPKLRRNGCPKCGEVGDKAHIGEQCYKTIRRRRSNCKRKVETLRIQLLRKLTEEKSRYNKRKGDCLITSLSKKARRF